VKAALLFGIPMDETKNSIFGEAKEKYVPNWYEKDGLIYEKRDNSLRYCDKTIANISYWQYLKHFDIFGEARFFKSFWGMTEDLWDIRVLFIFSVMRYRSARAYARKQIKYQEPVNTNMG
jgi:hypothetical protein